MANTKNLKVPSSNEARKNGAKGGRASAEARRKKKELRECLELLLESEIKAKNGTVMSGAEALSTQLFQKALKGDIKAFEVIRDTAGQKPTERIEQTNVDIKVKFDE